MNEYLIKCIKKVNPRHYRVIQKNIFKEQHKLDKWLVANADCTGCNKAGSILVKKLPKGYEKKWKETNKNMLNSIKKNILH